MFTSVQEDGSVDIKSLATELNDIFQRFESDIKNGQNITSCKEKLLEVSRALNLLSPCLPKFDRERYSSRIDSLLSIIYSARNGPDKKSRVLEKWKARSNPVNKSANIPNKSLTDDTMNIDPLTAQYHQEKFIKGKTIDFDIELKTYSNLLDCRLISSYKDVLLDISTLFFQNIQNSIIQIPLVPFKQGSILMENCRNSTVLFICPINSSIQVRLHTMSNCQFYICKKSKDQRQRLVIEDCSDCVFHEITKDSIDVDDFSNLNLGGKTSSTNYKFTDFPIPN